MLAKRVKKIKPSPTLALSARAKELKAKGINVISFSAGEPDFDTPANIKNAAIKAIEAGFTKYQPVSGTPELKKAIIEKLKRDNNLEYKPSEIVVSCGAKHSIYNVIQAVINPGDEVIIPSPYWVSYPDMVLLAGGKPVVVKGKEENGFKVTPKDVAKKITSKTRMFILNSPSNPTGAVYTKEELEELGKLFAKKKILVLSDEIYEKLVYDGTKHYSIVALVPELRSHSVIVNGVSKAYSMTGWRIGYAAGPEEIMKACENIQSQSTSNPTSISMAAAVEALNGPQDEVEKMRAEFERRRNIIVDGLNKIKGISCLKPQGAFYVFPNVKELIGKTIKGRKVKNSMDLSQIFLEEIHVAGVPGKEFGAEGYMRFSYATSAEQIEEGLRRIRELVEG